MATALLLPGYFWLEDYFYPRSDSEVFQNPSVLCLLDFYELNVANKVATDCKYPSVVN